MTSVVDGSIVLSHVEFDLLWEAEGLPPRHAALDVPSPGRTHTERARLETRAWQSLAERGLARRQQVHVEIADMLHLLARPQVAVDVWVWTDRRISGLAGSIGNRALLGVLDGEEVWLIPVRGPVLAESAVSVAGDAWPGVGHSVSLPHHVVRDADAEAGGDPAVFVNALGDRGVAMPEAQELGGMMSGIVMRGQFGAQRRQPDGRVRRADRVVAFHDTAAGRYLLQTRAGGNDRDWATITPAGNELLAERVWELLVEV